MATGIFGLQSLDRVADSVLEDFTDIDKSFETLKITKLREDYKTFEYANYSDIGPDSSE